MLPPGPRSRIPGRLLLTFGRDRLAFLDRVARDHGDVGFACDLGARMGFLSHPEHARDVFLVSHRAFRKGIGLDRARLLLGDGLLTSEGEFHMRQRRMMQPAFHRERIAAFGATMADFAEKHVARWQPGATLDVPAEMAALTLAIAGKTLFDADVEGDVRAIGEALGQSIGAFSFVLLPYGDRLVETPLPPARRFRQAKARLDAIVQRLVAERRAEIARGTHDRGDLLTMLVRARDEDAESGAGDASGAGRAGMTDTQVRDEALTILLAGHETTANALAWSWDFVARHPDVARRLHAEVDAVLGDADGRPRAATTADLARLPYARMVVSESMRLRPPAYVIGRRSPEPYAVPGTRYVFPPMTTIFMAQWVMQRDARWWPDPERFDPERWRAEVEGGAPPDRPRLAYFPFGVGTRVCIGEQFAWMELVLVLATIARRWTLELVDARPVAPVPVITLRPGPMRMIARARDDAARPEPPMDTNALR